MANTMLVIFALALLSLTDTSGQGHDHGGSSSAWYATWPLARTIGIRILYPGVMLSTELRKPLQADRSRQITNMHGVRKLLRATSGHLVDTMFFDRRASDGGHGSTLVISFEGNAGYYENGILQTPLAMGYSVLGWNHPGFGESTGLPYPANEAKAAEAVFDYALDMGFEEEDIVLYAWSIGGYTASHLAARHPTIKKLILDGTFDDILPLAMSKVPKLVSGIVATTLVHHFPLRLDKLLEGYGGPLVIIRRVDDEVITTQKQKRTGTATDLEHNRSTHLLHSIILHRYAFLVESSLHVQHELERWLAESHEESAARVVQVPKRLEHAGSRMSEEEKARFVIKMADAILLDHKTTHSTPLPPQVFEKAMLKGVVRKHKHHRGRGGTKSAAAMWKVKAKE